MAAALTPSAIRSAQPRARARATAATHKSTARIACRLAARSIQVVDPTQSVQPQAPGRLPAHACLVTIPRLAMALIARANVISTTAIAAATRFAPYQAQGFSPAHARSDIARPPTQEATAL